MAQDVVVSDIQEMPVSGRDYPRTWEQFLDWFPDNGACIEYLEGIRWPDGFSCPQCGVSDEPYRTSRGRLVCRDCGHQCTGTHSKGARSQTGMVFHRTRCNRLVSRCLVQMHILLRVREGNTVGVKALLNGFGQFKHNAPVVFRLNPRPHDKVDAAVSEF